MAPKIVKGSPKMRQEALHSAKMGQLGSKMGPKFGEKSLKFDSFFVIAYTIDSSIFNFSVVISLLAFIIFNVFTGRIFLGDFGSYSLSSLVAFKSLEFYSNNDISVFFLSAILIYPCFEIMRSLIIRAIKSRSIMAPDNNHLHNYLNKFVLHLLLL